MSDTVYQALALIVPLIFAIVFHEVAHGWVARALGDPTAQRMKRLTLNPLRHVDPIGTIVLPGLLALVKAPVFGWAKPVPVNKWMLRNPRYGMMAVAAAGPASNLILAGIAAVALGLLLRPYVGLQEPGGFAGFAALNLFNFISINIFLALFNLLPIPPFDGSHIVEGLLPRAWAPAYEKLRPLGFPIAIGLLIVLPWLIPSFDPVGAVVAPPVEWATRHYMALASFAAGQ
ncbi:MAG: peptidase [Novosphingobium sp.]|nr:peptidase [Novosphingobium sp.]